MEVVLSTAVLCLKQDSSQEEERARKEDKPSSSHLSLLEKTRMKNPVTTYQYQGRADCICKVIFQKKEIEHYSKDSLDLHQG